MGSFGYSRVINILYFPFILLSVSVLDFDLFDKLNPDAQEFVPTSFKKVSTVKRIKNNSKFIIMINKVFKKSTIPKLLPPCPKLIPNKRIVKTLEGLPCKKKRRWKNICHECFEKATLALEKTAKIRYH